MSSHHVEGWMTPRVEGGVVIVPGAARCRADVCTAAAAAFQQCGSGQDVLALRDMPLTRLLVEPPLCCVPTAQPR